jgi:RNA polymerase sigma-70 factor, ECF subfamily
VESPGTDEELMRRVMEGDEAALRLLVERHHRGLLAYLHRLSGGDRAEAEDLVQETLLRVVRGRTYRTGSPFRPWLFAIATNVARDEFRRHARRPSTSGDSALASMSSNTPDPAATAVSTDERRRVAAAIATLAIEYRAVLLMRFFHDMTLDAIAGALDVPVGTVKSRLYTGVRQLRGLLVGNRSGEK